MIDLKVGDLTHQDLGQMQMYVHYYERALMNERDNPPIGIVLCADKSESVVKYTLPENETQKMATIINNTGMNNKKSFSIFPSATSGLRADYST